jgi:hypothetical protein
MVSVSTDFIVNRRDLAECRVVHSPISPGAGDVVLAVEQFALTANNITYAVAGDSMSYWDFFPAEAGWGRVPVWGYARVLESQHPDIAVGERLYGYLPMSTHLLVHPQHVTANGFIDGVAHRAARAAVYNQYQRVTNDAGHAAAQQPAQMLLRPLFMTSFVLDDMLADNDFFGARAVILSSASSKTSLGLAYLLKHDRAQSVRVIGLTSPANRSFVRSLGYYDEVVTYDDVAQLDAGVPTAFVDMAGNGAVLRAVHLHFANQLRFSCLVGATHWQGRAGAGRDTLPGPSPQLFFAPSQIAKRNQDWGRGGVEQRFALAWNRFIPATADWLKVVRRSGTEQVQRTYMELLAGKAPPEAGYILSVEG